MTVPSAFWYLIIFCKKGEDTNENNGNYFGTGLCGVAGYEEIICEGINICPLPDDHSEACFAGIWKISAGGDQFFRGEFVYLPETGGDQYQNSEGYLYDTEVSSSLCRKGIRPA